MCVVKLYWQIKAPYMNLKKKWVMSILNLLHYSLFYIFEMSLIKTLKENSKQQGKPKLIRPIILKAVKLASGQNYIEIVFNGFFSNLFFY